MLNPLELAGQEIRKYRFEKMIGEGGMSYVYKGTHLDLDMQVAIKILMPELTRSKEVQERFRREGKVQFRLRHPNIVRVTDLIEEDGLICIVMDWIDGSDLADYINHVNAPIPFLDVHRLFVPILSAIGYAHTQHVIHRDLKPANILLDGAPGEEIPKIVDFGVAKSLTDTSFKTQTGSMLGTPYYLAPEVSQSKSAPDERVDVYSLGVMLFYMLTGRLPFIGNNTIEVMGAHLFQPVPSLHDFLPEVPPQLDAVVSNALAKKPEHRFANCEIFAKELDQVFGKKLEVANSPRLSPYKETAHFVSAVSSNAYSDNEAPPASEPYHAGQYPVTEHEQPIPTGEFEPFDANVEFDHAGAFEDLSTVQEKMGFLEHTQTSEPSVEREPEAAPPARVEQRAVAPAPASHVEAPRPYKAVEEATPAKSQTGLFLIAGLVVIALVLFAFFAGKFVSTPTRVVKPHTREPLRARTKPFKRPAKVAAKVDLVQDGGVPRPVRRAKTRVSKRRRVGLVRRRPPKQSFRRCYSCVRGFFLKNASQPGFQMGAYHGLCSADDFLGSGRRCARRCGHHYLHFCVSFLRQKFRKPRGGLQRYSAGTIPVCRKYVSEPGLLRDLRRKYPGQSFAKIARQCRKIWRTFR